MRCESGASGWMSARSGFVVLGLCCYASGAVFIMRRTGGRVLTAEDGKSFPEIDGGQDVAGGRRARRVRVLPASAFCPGSTANSCSAIDAAAFLHRAVKPVSWLKLQDLLYFAQAWHLVWDNELLFPEAILATEDGVHGLRHFAGVHYASQTSDLRKVRDHLRHSSMSTSEIYMAAAQDTDEVREWSIGLDQD